MRTTIDIPERDHRIFTSLARAQGVSLSQLVVELARRGLRAPVTGVEEASPRYTVNPSTGFPLFYSGRPITIEDVKALEDDE